MIWVVLLIIGLACAAIANGKGRNPVGWFFIGFFFGLIGLIIACVVSNERERQRMHAGAAAERRRLREKLRQEQMKNETYRQHTQARLDVHDDAIGIDTRRPAALAAGAAQRADMLEGGPPATPPPPGRKEWHYDMSGESRGPVSEAAIRKGLADGKIDGTTLVWREGMADWQAVSEVGAFRSSFLR